MPASVTDGWEKNWRLAFPRDSIGAQHLKGKGAGRDVTFTISRVQLEEKEMVSGAEGKKVRRKQKKLLVYFEELEKLGPEWPKHLILNVTNGATIASLYGDSPKPDWIGKKVTLYAEWVDAWGEKKEAVRIRPRVPGSSSRTATADDVHQSPPDEPE